MNWFLGSIQEAVATSKKRKAFFVVYIEGTDELSTVMTKVLDTAVVSRKFESNNFVAIKLTKGSEGHKQFEEFYKLVPVPSVFFIDQNGSPVEIVAADPSEENLLKKIDTAIEKCVPACKENVSLAATSSLKMDQPSTSTIPSSVASSSFITSEVSASTVQQTTNSTSDPKSSTSSTKEENNTEKMAVTVKAEITKKEESKENDSSSTKDSKKRSSDSEKPLIKEPSVEDRVEKAKELLEKKKEEKIIEERKKEKEREIERRKVGQEIQLAKREQQDRELRQLKEEREREKIEETLARQRILDQIAQDRAERAQRSSMTITPTPAVGTNSSEATAEVTPPSSVNSNIGRLQFKLPSGETKSHTFPADTTLLQVREFIDNNIVLPFSEYQMATTFPRREFTARDNNRDLRSLQLIPSAVILILPVHGNLTMRSTFGWTQMIIDMMWDLVKPVISLSRYISNLIFRRGNNETSSSGSRSQSPPSVAASSSSTGTSQSYSTSMPQRLGGRTNIKKRGNIYSLRDEADDDENNTWNGNSTQQM